MLDMALGVGKSYPTLVVSLEMSFSELQERALCSIAKLNYHRIKSGFYDLEIQCQLDEASKELKKQKVSVVDGCWKFYPEWFKDRQTKEHPKDSLRPLIQRAVNEYGVKAVFIDHLQFIRTEMYKLDSESLRLHEITQSLHELTVELNIPIVLMSQLRRLDQERKLKDPTPSMDDIRNSGQVEEDSNVICILHRPEYYRSKQVIDLFSNHVERNVELIIEKNRNGPTGKINLDFLAYCMSFRDCDFLEN
jgi:replicative DNA helicase